MTARFTRGSLAFLLDHNECWIYLNRPRFIVEAFREMVAESPTSQRESLSQSSSIFGCVPVSTLLVKAQHEECGFNRQHQYSRIIEL